MLQLIETTAEDPQTRDLRHSNCYRPAIGWVAKTLRIIGLCWVGPYHAFVGERLVLLCCIVGAESVVATVAPQTTLSSLVNRTKVLNNYGKSLCIIPLS